MKKVALLFVWCCAISLHAQPGVSIPPRGADFTATPGPGGLHFRPQFPPVQQVAGAPKAFYSCFWEFGDGSYSFEENPQHAYARPDDYLVSLDLTNNYDDGKKPSKKKRRVPATSGGGSAIAGVFEQENEAIALRTNSQPKAGESLTCILSYQNLSPLTTSGRVHLFFNEKQFPTAHFRYDTARTYFGETVDYSYSAVESESPRSSPDWFAPGHRSTAGVATPFRAEPPAGDPQAMLETARRHYREEQAWRFSDLRPGEVRNLFVDLSSTAGMIKDTSAFIHLEGIFEPFDPAIEPARFELEIEIVSSHDPNAIFVSDNRVNYRFLRRKDLNYKVRFQNNGEGPAHTVEIRVAIPEGLDMSRVRPLEWYPECPICPPLRVGGSCLDTTTARDGLTFIFRNIYLPGTAQSGLSDRDSTKGFVKYRIEPERRMPKRSFSSRAEIVFDKNPPIYTNYSRTRFKVGLSPGLKIGYAFPPDAAGDGYVFFGASLSPYKSWKIYPQLEFLTGIKGRAALPDAMYRDSMVIDQSDFKIVTFRDSTIRAEQRFLSFEIPVLLRKNFSRFFGVGLGASARFLLNKGDRTTHVTLTRTYLTQPGVPPIPPKPVRDDTYSDAYSERSVQAVFFGEITLGAVRAGPNVGIRAGGIRAGGQTTGFVQVSAEMKF